MTPRALLIITLAAALAGQALAAPAPAVAKVNINTASAAELQLLPRIGPAVAGRIVEFRDSHGAFKSVEELMRVRGVGEKTFELLKPYLTTEGQTTLKEKVKAPRSSKAKAASGGAPS
jgi:comEA protein